MFVHTVWGGCPEAAAAHNIGGETYLCLINHPQ